MADNTFPASVSLGERAIAWQESEIQEWMSNKIEERTITTSREPIKPEKKAITESEVISFINDRFSQLDMSDAITWVMKVFRQ